MQVLTSVLKNRALVTLAIGHMTNDMFAGVLPILYPLFKDDFHLSNAQIGLLTLAYTGTGSLLQPAFGYLADRVLNRWIASAILLWSTVFVSIYGTVNGFGLLLLVAALTGIGSAAYHPFGASNASKICDPETKNSAMSIYTVGGTTGYASGPLIAVALIWLMGRQGTLLLLVPGLACVTLLFMQMNTVVRVRQAREAVEPTVVAERGPVPWGLLVRIIAIVMLRSWAYQSLFQFVPIWYDDMGFGRGFYGPLATVMILSGVCGTLIGGSLADRIGGKRVIIASLALTGPALLLFGHFTGPIAFLIGACFGVASDSSLSVTLVAAQRLLPGKTGVASGLILGLGFVTAGIGVPITGALADHVGIGHAIMSLAVFSVLAIALTLPISEAVFRPAPPYVVDEAEPEATSLEGVPA
jgi:FSR family fosmidomycin resistance protein-like MFS transporter